MKKLILTFMLALLAATLFVSKSDASSIANTSDHPSANTSDHPSKVLNSYSGHYKSELIRGFEMDLFIIEGKLFAQINGRKMEEMLQIAPGRFQMNNGIKVEFMVENEEVLYMLVVKNGLTWLIKEN